MHISRILYHLNYKNAVNLIKGVECYQLSELVAKQYALDRSWPANDLDKLKKSIVHDHGKTLVLVDETKHITRVFTPGAISRTHATDAWKLNYTTSVCISAASRVGIAWADANDGCVHYQTSSLEDIHDDLARISPMEIIVESALDIPEVLEKYNAVHAKFPRNLLNYANFFDSYQSIKHVADRMSPVEVAAMTGLLGYLRDTSNGTSLALNIPKQYLPEENLSMDKRSRNTLELFSSSSRPSARGSLFSVIKRTKTMSGTRSLQELLSSPLRSLDKINRRLDRVQAFLESPTLLPVTQDLLRNFPDGKLALQRLAVETRPMDIRKWADSVEQMKELITVLGSDTRLAAWVEGMQHCVDNAGDLSRKITAYLHPHILNGGVEFSGSYQPIFIPKINRALSQLYKDYEASQEKYQEIIERYSRKYANPTIRWTSGYGHHILIKGCPQDSDVALRIGKRTSCIADAELTKIGQLREEFSSRVEQIEKKILSDLKAKILKFKVCVKSALDIVDDIDIAQSFASLSAEYAMTRPIIVEEPVIDIEGGRHLAVEKFLQLEEGSNFVTNDCKLSTTKLCMVTGPNMAGKSTYMRQIATIAILSHMGCYIPAERAVIGLIDKIFCRIGSGDDGYRGQSTFMIEMLETGHILRSATHKSLALLDEVGRGTSKKDGVALAFAAIQYLVTKNQCRALFATHFGQSIDNLIKNDNLEVLRKTSDNYKMIEGKKQIFQVML